MSTGFPTLSATLNSLHDIVPAPVIVPLAFSVVNAPAAGVGPPIAVLLIAPPLMVTLLACCLPSEPTRGVKLWPSAAAQISTKQATFDNNAINW